MELQTKGTLYLCATPIGNLEDMTYRAVRMLGEAGLIAAEDTRHTRQLLTHFDIHTKLTSYHEHNKFAKGPELIEYLLAGNDLICVSDAGLPGICDPGSHLAELAIEAGIRVSPLPGCNAGLSALICSGLDTTRFTFVGFLPKTAKKPRTGFTSDELGTIFGAALFQRGAVEGRKFGPAEFWLPLIGLYTGARIEEIAQLRVKEIRRHAALGYFFHITDEGEDSAVKNESSRRRVPIHQSLLDAGLLAYAEAIPEQDGYLFPTLTPDKYQRRSSGYGKEFGKFLRDELKILDRRKVFHSFRHLFKHRCRELGISEDVHDAMTGHTSAREALHESVLALLWRCPSQISVCFRYLGAPSGRCARATARFWRPYAPCTRSCPMHCSSLCLAIHRLPNANNVTICAVFFLSPR